METRGGVPAACGALGDFDREVVARLVGGFEVGLREAHRDERSALWLDREPIAWEGNPARGLCWSERLPARRNGARSWRDAATAGAVGMVLDGARRSVHASASGVGPLYWMADGRAAYFATAIDPLARAARRKLTPDWESWASIIVLGYPCGDGTPFAEIKRLNPLATLTAEDGAIAATAGELAWAEVEPEHRDDAAERIVDGVRADIEALDPQTPVRCLLSGGLDSRLLLCLLAERDDIELSAWTIDTEEKDDQRPLAAAVAASLAVPHSSVEAHDRPFADELRDAARLVEYESMLHLPMARLAGVLPGGAGAIVDGLGGDAFVNGLVLTPEVVVAPDSLSSVSRVFDRFASARSLPFSRDAGEALRAAARDSFMAEARRFDGHPAAATLTYWWTRNRRGISQAAVRLFGGRHDIVTPFIAEEAVRAAIGIPQAAKVNGALYRRVLEVAHRDAARLPTSGDGSAPASKNVRRLERSRQARQAYLPLLRESPLRPWFSERFAAYLDEGGLGGGPRPHFGLRRIQMLSSLSLWLERYRGLISAPDPSLLLPKPRARNRSWARAGSTLRVGAARASRRAASVAARPASWARDRGRSRPAPHRVATGCGAIGAFDPAVVERIASSLDAGLREVHRDGRSTLWLDREPIAWEAGDGTRGLGWSERVPELARCARSWRDAARLGACGLLLDRDRRAVHASLSGIGPVYWIKVGRAAYFCTALEPLLEATEAQLTPDWESWASIIALGYPCGDATPFAEIKRLNPLATLTAEDGTVAATAGELAWSEVMPGDPEEAAEGIVGALREEIASLDPDPGGLICPLSGGWDSRLLLCLLAERGLKPNAWTINGDEGNELEEQLAAPVAAKLGVPHSIVPPAKRSYADEFRGAVTLLEHQSVLRLRLAKLAAGLPARPRVVVDGLAGDILIDDRFTTEAVLRAPGWRIAVMEMVRRWARHRQRFPVLRPEAWEPLRTTAGASFMRDAERFADHPAAATLSQYWHRTRRGISGSPVALHGARHEVAMPFLADRVVRAALLASPEAKHGGRLYRRVFEIANADVGRLPSTRDDLPQPARTRPRPDRALDARRAYAALLAGSPLRPWFSDELERALERGNIGPLVRTGWAMGRVHTLCNLTIWMQRHRGRLSAADPSPLFGG